MGEFIAIYHDGPNDEAEVAEIVWAMAAFAKRFKEPSPITLARLIATSVQFMPHSRVSERVHLRALEVARQVGDWCGGYLDPDDIVRRCLWKQGGGKS